MRAANAVLILFLYLNGSSAYPDSLQTITNHDPNHSFIEPYRKTSHDGFDFELEIIKKIRAAKKRIWIAVYELRLPNLAHELVNKKNEGVDVRIITENSNRKEYSRLTADQILKLSEYEKRKYEDFLLMADGLGDRNSLADEKEKAEVDGLRIIIDGKVPLIDDANDGSKGSGLMHHKFIVIDQNEVIISSANFTMSDFYGDYRDFYTHGNENAMTRIQSSQAVQAFESEFLVMWGTGAIGTSRFGIKKGVRSPILVKLNNEEAVIIRFSPSSSKTPFEQTTNGWIAKVIKSAKKSIDFLLFVFSEQKIANEIELRTLEGVKVRGLIDHDFAFRYYSELLDMIGLYRPNLKCVQEKDNHIWSKPAPTVGTAMIPIGDKLHHKLAIIDDQTVLFGSHNWSAAANNQNDETLLTMTSSNQAKSFHEEFERLYRYSQLGVPEWLLKKIVEEKKKCGIPLN